MDVPQTDGESNCDHSCESPPAGTPAQHTCYDLVVIGGGQFAAAVAHAASSKAKRVAVVVPEQLEQWLHCYRRQILLEVFRQAAAEGCQPAAEPRRDDTAESARAVSAGNTIGRHRLSAAQFSAMVSRARQAVRGAAAEAQIKRLTDRGVAVFAGGTRFTGRNAITVDGVSVRFGRAILAVEPQCRPAPPAGIDPAACLSLQQLCELNEVPERLGVFGAGPLACTLAQLFCRLGSEVYLLCSEPHLLPGENQRAAAIVEQTLRREGVRLRLGCDAMSVEAMGRQQAVLISRDGRREKMILDRWVADFVPANPLETLEPEAGGIATNSLGATVNRRLQTTNRRVFAPSAVMTSALWHDSAVHFIAQRLLQVATARWTLQNLPFTPIRCTWTSPELLQVGLTAQQAAAACAAVRTYQSEPAEPARETQRTGESAWAALHTEESSGQLLGACVVGERTAALATVLLLLFQGKIALDCAAVLAASVSRCGAVLADLLDQYRRERPTLVAKLTARFSSRGSGIAGYHGNRPHSPDSSSDR